MAAALSANACGNDNMRPALLVLPVCLTFTALTGTARAAEDVHARLMELGRNIVYSTASMYPTQATQLGIPGHDGELETPSEDQRNAYLAKLRQWQGRLEEIAPASHTDIGLVDRDDARLLGAQLTTSLNTLLVRKTDRKDYAAGATNIVATLFTQLQFLPVAGRDGKTARDVDEAWADIVSRLRKAPRYITAAQSLATEPGHLYGVVGREQLEGAPSLFNGALTEAAQAHYAHDHKAFARFVAA
jgi:Bacterial protein of unknown function (DUF885)